MRGFTLIELLVVIGVLGISLAAAGGLFTQTFRSGGQTEQVISVETNMRHVLGSMVRAIKNARQIESVGGSDCPAVGTSLSILGWDNQETTYELVDDAIASNGASLNATDVLVDSLQFECFRVSGVPDRIEVAVEARSELEEASEAVEYERVINLRNY